MRPFSAACLALWSIRESLSPNATLRGAEISSNSFFVVLVGCAIKAALKYKVFLSDNSFNIGTPPAPKRHQHCVRRKRASNWVRCHKPCTALSWGWYYELGSVQIPTPPILWQPCLARSQLSALWSIVVISFRVGFLNPGILAANETSKLMEGFAIVGEHTRHIRLPFCTNNARGVNYVGCVSGLILS